MARYDFRSPRLFVDAALETGAVVALDRSQAHYLTTVLRLGASATVLVFNGRDGEWRAVLGTQRRSVILRVDRCVRPQTAPGDLHYLFAPLKAARFDYMVQKAVELGVSRLQPVFTRHSHVNRINTGRMRANAIEAAEQCGILVLPDIAEATPLPAMLAAMDAGRHLIFCDEEAPLANPVDALKGVPAHAPLAVLIGPEGGFADDERAVLLQRHNVVRLALGPRILRADTAAVAALTLVQAVVGDWSR